MFQLKHHCLCGAAPQRHAAHCSFSREPRLTPLPTWKKLSAEALHVGLFFRGASLEGFAVTTDLSWSCELMVGRRVIVKVLELGQLKNLHYDSTMF